MYSVLLYSACVQCMCTVSAGWTGGVSLAVSSVLCRLEAAGVTILETLFQIEITDPVHFFA